jgi:hypothetical protein
MSNKSFQGLFSPLEVVSTNNLLKIQQDQCKLKMSRIYYSSLFKVFYSCLIGLSLISMFLSFVQFYSDHKMIFLLEVTVTMLLVFEAVYRGFMQGWNEYVRQVWNIVDVFVTIASIALLWVGHSIGGGVGRIDTLSATSAIVVRTAVQLVRLILALRKRSDQDIQIIDLNGISEGDEIPQHTEKQLKSEHPVLRPNKKMSYDAAVDESQ